MATDTLATLLAAVRERPGDRELRLVCADAMEDDGQVVASALHRLLAALPDCGGSWNAYHDGWHVVITWGSAEYVAAYPFGEPQQSCGWFFWWRNRAVKKGRRAPVHAWSRWRGNSYQPASPPPALEAAVVAVLLRRLAEVG